MDKDEVKDSIIGVARQIFCKFGFRKTTMDEIAQAVRKGKSSIYYYFSSKEDIFQAVVEKEAALLNSALMKAISEADDPREKLKSYVLVRMRTISELANFYNAIKSEYLSHLEFIDQIRMKYDKNEIQVVEDILRKGVENNEFCIEDTSLAAIAIVTALKGMEIPMFWEKDAEEGIEQRLDSLINFLFYGIIKR
ncbi:MAG: TetR/AcrR family transcriptional regulator [Bacteroidetes bacterium]|nr:TetR/AcrR family transcriptional regulator [Bacteroidota bacterium]